jgi:hypothetical protein
LVSHFSHVRLSISRSKEKEAENRRKVALAQAAHEARLAEIAMTEAMSSQQTQKRLEDIKTPAASQAAPKTQQGSNSSSDAQQNKVPTATNFPLTGSPSLPIKIHPEKQSETLCKIASPASLPAVHANKEHGSKVGNPATSSDTNIKDTLPETAGRPNHANTLPKTTTKPTDIPSPPVKASTSAKSSATAVNLKQTRSLGSRGTEESNSVLPVTSGQASSRAGSGPANPEVAKCTKKSITPEMDVVNI